MNSVGTNGEAIGKIRAFLLIVSNKNGCDGVGNGFGVIAYKVLVKKSNTRENKTAMHQILFLYALNGKLI